MSTDPKKAIAELIDERIREALTEMPDRPPRERKELATTVAELLKVRPLASDHGHGLLEALRGIEPHPLPKEPE